MGTVEVHPPRATVAHRERRVGKTKETKDVHKTDLSQNGNGGK